MSDTPNPAAQADTADVDKVEGEVIAEEPERTGTIDEPAKILRIGSMVKQLLEEVRNSELDEASRDRLRDIHDTSIEELGQALSPDLREELERLSLPFEEETPTESELMIAQAQLVGWLEGLFQGIQATLFAQQAAAQAQLQNMRGQLQAGGGQPGMAPGQPGPGQAATPSADPRPGSGQYL